jgi:hypothetical protein
MGTLGPSDAGTQSGRYGLVWWQAVMSECSICIFETQLDRRWRGGSSNRGGLRGRDLPDPGCGIPMLDGTSRLGDLEAVNIEAGRRTGADNA